MSISRDVMVSIGVLTYNQEHYIRQCLDSILMQKVNFDFEIIIGDDCSTDLTPDILKEYNNRYPDIVIPLLNESNVGISANYKIVLNKCKGKYIAFCEGDDYWLSTTRLQEQIDFLENHPDYGFVGGNVNVLNGRKTAFESYNYLPSPKIEGDWELYEKVLEFAKYGPVTRTVTLCFRKSIIDPFISIEGIGNDLVLQTILAKNSSFAKLRRVIGVYRQNGISNSRTSIESIRRYSDWRYECLTLQKQLFPQDCNWDPDEIYDNRYYSIMRFYISHFQFTKAIEMRSKIKSDKFKSKASYRYSSNIVSLLFLSIWSHFRNR